MSVCCIKSCKGKNNQPGTSQYKWSSYRATAGLEDEPDFLAVDEVLSQFNPKRDEAVMAYREFVDAGIEASSPWEDLKGQCIFLVTKGGFDEHNIFHPLSWIDTRRIALLFRDKVFSMLIQEGKISQGMAVKISEWPHSGFNIHNQMEID